MTSIFEVRRVAKWRFEIDCTVCGETAPVDYDCASDAQDAIDSGDLATHPCAKA